MSEREILVSVVSKSGKRVRLGVAMAASLAVAGVLIAVGNPAHASTVATGAQTSAAKPASPSSKLITQINTTIHKKKGLGKTVHVVDVETYSVAPSWVYSHADSKKFGPVDVLLQYSAKKWHVKDYGTSEVGCGTAPKKLLKALDQTCPSGAATAAVSAGKPASPSSALLTQVNTTIHKKKGLGKGVHALDVATYSVAPSWVYAHADSKKFGSVDVLLQYSTKKWHVKDYGTAEVGCGTAPKKLLKALDQTC